MVLMSGKWKQSPFPSAGLFLGASQVEASTGLRNLSQYQSQHYCCMCVCVCVHLLNVDACVHTMEIIRDQVWGSYLSNYPAYFFPIFLFFVSFIPVSDRVVFVPISPLFPSWTCLIHRSSSYFHVSLMCGSLNKKFLAGTQGSQIQLTFWKHFSARLGWLACPKESLFSVFPRLGSQMPSTTPSSPFAVAAGDWTQILRRDWQELFINCAVSSASVPTIGFWRQDPI